MPPRSKTDNGQGGGAGHILQRLSPDDVDQLLGLIFGRNGGISCIQFRMLIRTMLGALVTHPQACGNGSVWHLACIRYGWAQGKPVHVDWYAWFNTNCDSEKAKSTKSPTKPPAPKKDDPPDRPKKPKRELTFAKSSGRPALRF